MQQSRQTPAFAVAAFAAVAPAAADPMLADFDYPYGVHRFAFRSQEQSLAMAYMDVTAGNANGKTVVLLHGKNFCGGDMGGCRRPAKRGRLPRRHSRPDRLLQVLQTARLPIRPPPTRGQHPCAARQHRGRAPDHHRPFHGRHAGVALRAHVSGRYTGSDRRQRDRPGGLEGQGPTNWPPSISSTSAS